MENFNSKENFLTPKQIKEKVLAKILNYKNIIHLMCSVDPSYRENSFIELSNSSVLLKEEILKMISDYKYILVSDNNFKLQIQNILIQIRPINKDEKHLRKYIDETESLFKSISNIMAEAEKIPEKNFLDEIRKRKDEILLP